ncbi:MAG: hypothetical protein MI923_02705 [Phycisphaerales bacterium]|nr:hypothetical protein [Phycisphaerales bacterium]
MVYDQGHRQISPLPGFASQKVNQLGPVCTRSGGVDGYEDNETLWRLGDITSLMESFVSRADHLFKGRGDLTTLTLIGLGLWAACGSLAAASAFHEGGSFATIAVRKRTRPVVR